MDPGSRVVELPPRGADLSFLSNNPDTDTPSRWLTFNSTPGGINGGNTTPGTAFGSPFWGSLLGPNSGLGSAGAQSTTNLTPTGGAAGHAHAASLAGGQHSSSRLSPKNFSPSKEFNPFELSFFPKHNEHLLKGSNAKGAAEEGSEKKVKNEESGEGDDTATATTGKENGGKNSLNSSVSSLKRPFQEGNEEDGDANAPSSANQLTSLQSDAASRTIEGDSSSSASHPSWQKRPKIEELHSMAPISSSDQSTSTGNTISAPSSMYAPSPMNMNASPDSGMSPASSAMIPTPSLQHAILPPNATPSTAAGAVFNGSTNSQQRKMSIPPEQVEASKLTSANGTGLMAGPGAGVPLQPHQQPHLYNVQPSQQQQQQQQQSGLMTQTVPPPLNAAGYHAAPHHHHQHLPPGGHPFSYSGYIPPAQQQQQPVILPPKTLQQAQAAQQQQHQHDRTMSPVEAGSANAKQPSPVPTNNNPIPYANGRGPSATRPSRATTRSSHNKRGTSAATGNGNATNDEQSFVKEEEDANMYDSSSAGGGGNNSYSNNNNNNASATNTKAASGAGNTATKGGKKGKKQGGGRAGSAGASNKSAAAAASNTAPAFSAYGDYNAAGNSSNGITGGDGANGGDEDEEGGDDEHKRKAFLERNRQAACRSRQKKKEWINNLETHAARLQSENQSLASEIELLRKELFALRHTLSFHERSGCTANPSTGVPPPHAVQQPPPAQIAAQPPSATLQQQQQQPPAPVVLQQQQRPEWRQQQQVQAPPQQQQQPQGYQQQQGINHVSQGPAIVQTHPSPQSQQVPMQSTATQPPPPVHIQTQPQPMNANPRAVGAGTNTGSGPTLAPSALQGMSMPSIAQRPPSAMQDSQQQLSAAQQRAPPKLNLSQASLQPQQQQAQHQTGMNTLAPNSHQLPSHGSHLGNPSDINRPGSAGATFGLATPNFADLFNGAMGKLGSGGQTPFLGAGLLFTPGGITSSGGMLGGGFGPGSHNGTGYNMSPALPNTFGLSMQDIPIRPASAPPTPSPALDTRLMAPSQDYFSSKNLSSNIGTSAAFADFLAAYNPTNLQTGSVLA
ncbi:hypothetical protein P389DRAFT_10064 [Cystobasidium minutum MCA 4210]|uniref:uncharacterized protein n=1 Tax=Cystobasidium minutum MCA 4210 TaxID=1397322 RepID=UPI0034CD3A44|eukprot:jgi/Rhomi1/10064/CE10063_2346